MKARQGRLTRTLALPHKAAALRGRRRVHRLRAHTATTSAQQLPGTTTVVGCQRAAMAPLIAESVQALRPLRPLQGVRGDASMTHARRTASWRRSAFQ